MRKLGVQIPLSSARSLIEANPTDSLIAFHRKMQVELIDSLAIIINTAIFCCLFFGLARGVTQKRTVIILISNKSLVWDLRPDLNRHDLNDREILSSLHYSPTQDNPPQHQSNTLPSCVKLLLDSVLLWTGSLLAAQSVAKKFWRQGIGECLYWLANPYKPIPSGYAYRGGTNVPGTIVSLTNDQLGRTGALLSC